MRRYWPIIVAVLLSITIANAAPVSRLFFPVIAQGATQPTLTRLVDQDCGLVNATLAPDGRIFVAYQTRPDGTVYLTEDVGDHLQKITVPITQAASLAPAGSDLPGPKQGSVSQIVKGGMLHVYFTGRASDDPTGPFYVWRLVMSVPGVTP